MNETHKNIKLPTQKDNPEKNMKTKCNKTSASQGFTLIEMIGVLAVIAILAAILAPKVFEAIQASKISNAVTTIQTLGQAVNDHFAKQGRFTGVTGLADPTGTEVTDFANVLVGQGLIEKKPTLKIGSTVVADRPVIIVEAGLSTSGVTADATNAAYDLDGDATVVNDAGGAQWVLSLVIKNVTGADAKLLNDKIDGLSDPFDAGELEAENTEGRVKYGAPSSTSDFLTTVRVYLAHR